MCSFGDINIPSSRAFWDDCDEDEVETNEKPLVPLQLKYEGDYESAQPTASDLLLCIEGLNITDFVQHTLLQSSGFTKLCSIPAKQSSLHWHAGKKLLVAALDEHLDSSGEVTELLQPFAQAAQKVITVNVKPKVDFKTENYKLVRDEITFIRALNGELPEVPVLETPNFIAGVAAGIASWRDNNSLPVSSYVAYTDNLALDNLAARPIVRLLEQLGLQTDGSYKPKSKVDSHLYS